jgi:hypothetical protein
LEWVWGDFEAMLAPEPWMAVIGAQIATCVADSHLHRDGTLHPSRPGSRGLGSVQMRLRLTGIGFDLL